MRLQHRNLQKFKYAKLLSNSPVVDEDGNYTGEYAPVYSTPKVGWGNINSGYISANHMSGTATATPFGTNIEYIKTIMTGCDYGMDENTVVWIDDLNASSHDYVIRRIGKSHNSIRYACSRVDTSTAVLDGDI